MLVILGCCRSYRDWVNCFYSWLKQYCLYFKINVVLLNTRIILLRIFAYRSSELKFDTYSLTLCRSLHLLIMYLVSWITSLVEGRDQSMLEVVDTFLLVAYCRAKYLVFLFIIGNVQCRSEDNIELLILHSVLSHKLARWLLVSFHGPIASLGLLSDIIWNLLINVRGPVSTIPVMGRLQLHDYTGIDTPVCTGILPGWQRCFWPVDCQQSLTGRKR